MLRFVDLLPVIFMVLVPAVIGLALFGAAAALFTSAVSDSDDTHSSPVGTGVKSLLGGCAALVGCGFVIIALGVVYCAGVAAPLH